MVCQLHAVEISALKCLPANYILLNQYVSEKWSTIHNWINWYFCTIFLKFSVSLKIASNDRWKRRTLFILDHNRRLWSFKMVYKNCNYSHLKTQLQCSDNFYVEPCVLSAILWYIILEFKFISLKNIQNHFSLIWNFMRKI